MLGALPALGLAVAWGGMAAAALAPLAWWGAQLAHLWRRRELLALAPLDLALAPLADLLAVAIWAGGILGLAAAARERRPAALTLFRVAGS